MLNVEPIGGFFELETPRIGKQLHSNVLALTNGRSCIRWIMENEKPTRVFIPYYICDAVCRTVADLGIDLSFYSIDDQFSGKPFPSLRPTELLILVNYFGLNSEIAIKTSRELGKQVIVDNTHLFFHNGYNDSYSFTSARKWFGVPDGAYLFNSDSNAQDFERNTGVSLEPYTKKLMGCDDAHQHYLSYEASLTSDVRRISIVSERILSAIDYNSCANRRIDNFIYVHKHLGSYNTLTFDLSTLDVPFCYPFFPAKQIDKNVLYKNGLYIPTFWPDVHKRGEPGFTFEKDLANRLLPLPIDQRYTSQELQRMVNFIKVLFKR